MANRPVRAKKFKKVDGEQAVVLKAFGGDRCKNLEAIAKEFDEFIDITFFHPGTPRYRQMKGYCEQLRIIADELRLPFEKKLPDFPVVEERHLIRDTLCLFPLDKPIVRVETPQWLLEIDRDWHLQNATILGAAGKLSLPDGKEVTTLGEFYDGLLGGESTRPHQRSWLAAYWHKP